MPCMIADRGGDEFLSVPAVIIIIIKVFLKRKIIPRDYSKRIHPQWAHSHTEPPAHTSILTIQN